MKKQILAAAAATLLITSAMAASDFEGLFAQVGIGYQNNNIDSSTLNYSSTSGSGSVSINSGSSSDFSSLIALGYNFSAGNDWLIGVGADFSLNNPKAENVSVSGGSGGGQVKVSNRYDIFVQPTMLLGKDAAVYAKLGYSSQKLKLTDTTSSSDTYGATLTNSSVSGYLVGLGYKAIFNKWWYGFAEANYYSYSAPSSNSLTANNTKYTGYTPSSSAYEGIVGIGYKF